MPNFWMVRAGEGGYLAKEFLNKGCVAVGFDGMGDMSSLNSLEAIRAAVSRTWQDRSPVQVAVAAGVANKFRNVIATSDLVLTYDPEERTYHLGSVEGEYQFKPGLVTDYAHVRRVRWIKSVSRDGLSVDTRNTLGSTLTIFEPGDTVLQELQAASSSAREVSISAEIADHDDAEIIYSEQLGRSFEFIKDRIARLDSHQMEELAAALLRALGFRTRISPRGPDRGVDVIASPDGLGLQSPRILCEVKHRKGSMGAPEIRNFSGTLRVGDRGLYLSTGGFTKEAKYEAERTPIPVTLLDLDELARLVVEHYEAFDTEGKALIPLRRFYWPMP